MPVSTALSATLATPLFFIGMAGLATAGIKLALGSSEGRLVQPCIMMLNQLLLLAVEGVNVDDYFHRGE